MMPRPASCGMCLTRELPFASGQDGDIIRVRPPRDSQVANPGNEAL
jgi:hypothetical protein